MRTHNETVTKDAQSVISDTGSVFMFEPYGMDWKSNYYTIIEWLAFPADIGRKPASLACGSRQRIHAAARTGFVGDAYTPVNETADGTTLRRPYGA